MTLDQGPGSGRGAKLKNDAELVKIMAVPKSTSIATSRIGGYSVHLRIRFPVSPHNAVQGFPKQKAAAGQARCIHRRTYFYTEDPCQHI
jgi:hypothetical protein